MSNKSVTIIETTDSIVLFSYSTPVAYFDKLNQKVFQTNKKWSRTTTKHINEFYGRYILNHLSAFNPEYLDQEILDQKFPMCVTRF